MGSALWVVAGLLAATALVAVAMAARLTVARRTARDERAGLAAELEALKAEVRDLERRLPAQSREAAPRVGAPDYVITGLGTERSDDSVAVEGRAVASQVLLSAAFGEPLVKAIALGHGLRRALSAESRNRIGFEVRREVRRSRKVRRREMREAWRAMRAGSGPAHFDGSRGRAPRPDAPVAYPPGPGGAPATRTGTGPGGPDGTLRPDAPAAQPPGPGGASGASRRASPRETDRTGDAA